MLEREREVALVDLGTEQTRLSTGAVATAAEPGTIAASFAGNTSRIPPKPSCSSKPSDEKIGFTNRRKQKEPIRKNRGT